MMRNDISEFGMRVLEWDDGAKGTEYGWEYLRSAAELTLCWLPAVASWNVSAIRIPLSHKI